MQDNIPYIKKGKDFNREFAFVKSAHVLQCGLLPNQDLEMKKDFNPKDQIEKRNPNFISLSNFPIMSENYVNTERVSTNEQKMIHLEGGWPKDINETNEKVKHIKKKLIKTADNTDKFAPSVKNMYNQIIKIMDKNDQIDMFEEYFEDEEPEFNIEELNVKTLILFKDIKNQGEKRTISKISWHPDGPTKIAASYCILKFQKQPSNMCMNSYIWDLTNPNVPLNCLKTESPLTCIAYNHKNVDQIVGGCYNGIIKIYDARINPLEETINTPVKYSHHEPITDIIWMSSKGGTEFISCSTDGNIYWWDAKKLDSGPTDSLEINYNNPLNEKEKEKKIIGGTSLEYIPDYGPKYLIGTEKGTIMLATKKPRKKAEINYQYIYGSSLGKHLGPIYSIHRNPFNNRYFLSVGDWSVNIWEDEVKIPIIKTRFHSSYLTDGCWSITRPGLFFVTRKDGWLDIWDYYYRQNEVALSHKVSDASLTAIKLNSITGSSQLGTQNVNNGKYCAIGDSNGTITILKLCQSLYEIQPNEKEIISEIFDREKKKELNLKTIRLQKKEKGKKRNKKVEISMENEEINKKKLEEEINCIEKKFRENIRSCKENMKEFLDYEKNEYEEEDSDNLSNEKNINGNMENGNMENGNMENGNMENGNMENGNMENGNMENGNIENGSMDNGNMENEMKEENKDEVKEENKDEMKEENKDEVKEENKVEMKEENKDEVKEENKEDIKDEMKVENKEELKEENIDEKKEENKEDMKEEEKDEINEEKKDDIKEEVKEENKDEIKEENKNDIKDENKEENLENKNN